MDSAQEKPVTVSTTDSLPSHDVIVDDIVDGGFAAWSTVIGGFLMAASTFGYANSFGVYQDLYTRSNAASASAISWIGSTQFFLLFAMALPAGKLLDMGYFRITTLIGSLIYVFSLFMVSLSHPDKFYQLYLSQGLGMGIGAGLIYLPTLAVQTHHWRARKVFAMGIVTTGSSIGGIIFPNLLNHLFKSVGFQWGVRASAFIVLALLLIGNLLLKPRPPAKVADRPEPDFRGILTDKPYLITIFAVFVLSWGIFFPYFYLQLFAVLHGVSARTAFNCLAILNAAAIPGRIIPNILADRFGPYTVGIPCTISCGILIFALIGVKTVAGVVVIAILYGFMSGAVLALTAPVFAALAKGPHEVGIRFGIAFFLSSFGVLIGNPIDGKLLGKIAWTKPITFSGTSVFVGAVCLIITRLILVNQRGSQFV